MSVLLLRHDSILDVFETFGKLNGTLDFKPKEAGVLDHDEQNTGFPCYSDPNLKQSIAQFNSLALVFK